MNINDVCFGKSEMFQSLDNCQNNYSYLEKSQTDLKKQSFLTKYI